MPWVAGLDCFAHVGWPTVVIRSSMRRQSRSLRSCTHGNAHNDMIDRAQPCARPCAQTSFMGPGDGKTNDTAALLRAIAELTEAGQPGVLIIEPGTYVLMAQINVSAPIVLRGAGVDATTLFFPHSLSEVMRRSPATHLNRVHRVLASCLHLLTAAGLYNQCCVAFHSSRWIGRVWLLKWAKSSSKGRAVQNCSALSL